MDSSDERDGFFSEEEEEDYGNPRSFNEIVHEPDDLTASIRRTEEGLSNRRTSLSQIEPLPQFQTTTTQRSHLPSFPPIPTLPRPQATVYSMRPPPPRPVQFKGPDYERIRIRNLEIDAELAKLRERLDEVNRRRKLHISNVRRFKIEKNETEESKRLKRRRYELRELFEKTKKKNKDRKKKKTKTVKVEGVFVKLREKWIDWEKDEDEAVKRSLRKSLMKMEREDIKRMRIWAKKGHGTRKKDAVKWMKNVEKKLLDKRCKQVLHQKHQEPKNFRKKWRNLFVKVWESMEEMEKYRGGGRRRNG